MPNGYHDVQSAARECKIVSGAFKPNGSSAIDNTVNKGVGWTVAYTSTGLYTVTLDRVYYGHYGVLLTLAMNALTDTQLQLGAIDLTAKTILINAYNIDAEGAVSLVDIAAHANNWIHFAAFMKRTSLVR